MPTYTIINAVKLVFLALELKLVFFWGFNGQVLPTYDHLKRQKSGRSHMCAVRGGLRGQWQFAVAWLCDHICSASAKSARDAWANFTARRNHIIIGATVKIRAWRVSTWCINSMLKNIFDRIGKNHNPRLVCEKGTQIWDNIKICRHGTALKRGYFNINDLLFSNGSKIP